MPADLMPDPVGGVVLKPAPDSLKRESLEQLVHARILGMEPLEVGAADIQAELFGGLAHRPPHIILMRFFSL
jgi:hypothetical protein